VWVAGGVYDGIDRADDDAGLPVDTLDEVVAAQRDNVHVITRYEMHAITPRQ
jgi:hypothetical protein